jgi:hypothetical protein
VVVVVVVGGTYLSFDDGKGLLLPAVLPSPQAEGPPRDGPIQGLHAHTARCVSPPVEIDAGDDDTCGTRGGSGAPAEAEYIEIPS